MTRRPVLTLARPALALVAAFMLAAGPGAFGGAHPARADELAHASSALASTPRILENGDWVLAEGETPRSLARLLFPDQYGMQRRFIAMLAAGNPHLDFSGDGDHLPGGTVLHMPDWKAFAMPLRQRSSVVAPARQPNIAQPFQNEAGSGEPLSARRAAQDEMWLSVALSPAPFADAATRQWLRLEYRLLGLLESHIAALAPAVLTDAVRAPQLPSLSLRATESAVQVEVQAEAGREEPAGAPAPAILTERPASDERVPLRASAPDRQANPGSSGAPVSGGGDFGALSLPVAGVAVVLLLSAWLLRSRRAALPAPALAEAETLVLEAPPDSASASSAAGLTAFPAAARDAVAAGVVAAPSPPAAASTEVPGLPDSKDPAPVMELAEIMLSFGRIQGAAQTLEEYLEANPAEAVQPWVRLLQIYREAGMHAEFDTIAGRFHERFNVELQQWAADAAPPVPRKRTGEAVPRALSIEDLPHIRDRLIEIWGTQACLDYLRALLRDNRGGERTGFTLPVVQEMLLLIDILACRDTA